MVNLQKSGDSAVKFVFTDSDHYLYGNGEIEVPVNSLLLVIDESEMVTFKKLSGDPFLSFRADNSNLGTKAAIEQFYKDNMVGSTGGGSESGITSGEVQTMIDESISGKADTSDVTAVANDVQTVSGQVATKVATTDFNTYSAATDSRLAEDEEVTAAALNDLQENKADTSAVTAVQQSLSGKQDTLVSGTNIKTINNESILGSGNITISGGGGSYVYYTEDTSNESATIMVQNDGGLGNRSENRVFVDGGDIIIESYNETDDGEGNTGTTDTQVDINSLGLSIIAYSDDGIDTTQTELEVQPMGAYINSEPIATEPYVDAALSGKADTSAVTAAIDAAISGKVDTSAITSAITSGSTDAQVPSAKATYEAITAATTGGGATYSAGTNINIDTGNTISCTLPITANSTNSIAVGGSSSNLGQFTCFTLGGNENKSRVNGFAAARQCSIKNIAEAAFGSAPNTVGNYTGDTYFRGREDATLFTVGNGDTNFGGRHNALEIRQSGNIYFADTDNTTYANYYQKPMVRLQDMYGALGGLKFVSLSQSDYDALVSGGTVDSSTIYFISNVVS